MQSSPQTLRRTDFPIRQRWQEASESRCARCATPEAESNLLVRDVAQPLADLRFVSQRQLTPGQAFPFFQIQSLPVKTCWAFSVFFARPSHVLLLHSPFPRSVRSRGVGSCVRSEILCVTMMPPMDYRTYLESAQWKRKRQQALAYHGRTCQACGATRGLQIHHLHYRTPDQERMPDLVVLCSRCHRKGQYSRWEIEQDRKALFYSRILLSAQRILWRGILGLLLLSLRLLALSSSLFVRVVRHLPASCVVVGRRLYAPQIRPEG